MSGSSWPHGLQPSRLSVHGDSPGKNIGVGCHALLQGSSQPRDQTQVSFIAGEFFSMVSLLAEPQALWATSEALQSTWVESKTYSPLETTISTPSWKRWRRQWHPTPVLLPGESPWTESLADYSPWSCKESDMTERLSTIPHALLLGESMYFWEASQYMIPSGTISGISNSSATSPERIPSLTLTHNLVNHWVQANLSGLNYSFQRIFQPNSFWGMPFGLAFGEGNTRSLETHASLGFSRNIMFDYSWFTVP